MIETTHELLPRRKPGGLNIWEKLMPRKKIIKEIIEVRFVSNINLLNSLREYLNDTTKFGKNHIDRSDMVELEIFYHLYVFDYIASLYFRRKTPIPVNQKITREKVGMSNCKIILDNLIELGYIKCANIKAKFGCSQSYYPNCDVECIDFSTKVFSNKYNKIKISNLNRAHPDMCSYFSTIKNMSLHEKVDGIKQKIYDNDECEYQIEINHDLFMYESKSKFMIDNNKRKKTRFTKGEYNKKCKDRASELVDKMVWTVNVDRPMPTRPMVSINYVGNKDRSYKKPGRVYCSLTNIYRELKSAIRINGNKIIGVDVRNCQPLLASILFYQYFEDRDLPIPEDVKQYRIDCERGEFYEYFMKEYDIDSICSDKNLLDIHRSLFKKDFFSDVIFGKKITGQKDINKMTDLFMRKYPGCFEALQYEKGEYYSDYKNVSKKLQIIESEIFFDEVNLPLINKGIDAFNQFDSIYVGTDEHFEVAIELVKNAFAKRGCNPNLKKEKY